MTDVDVDLPVPAPPAPNTPLPLPQPDDQPAHIESAHLFGATLFGDAPAGGIVPTPTVSIAGAPVASGPDSSLTYPMVVDGLSITWGRSEALDQPAPATASLSIFDPTAHYHRNVDLIGQLVTISYTATKPGVGDITTMSFIGRITTAKVLRKSVRRSDGVTVNGTLIALTASSLINDLANTVPRTAFPAETLDARRSRLAGLSTNVATSVTVRGYWAARNVGPVAATDQVSVLDSLMNLYGSTGPDRFSFQPSTQQIIQVERRSMGAATTLGALTWRVAGQGTTRDGLGAFAISTASTVGVDGGMAGVRLYLDGSHIEYEPDNGLSKDITSRLTRIEYQHPDGAASFASRVETAYVPDVSEQSSGVRTAQQDSLLSENAYAVIAAGDLAQLAGREGAGWRTDPITVRTKLRDVDGFDEWDQLVALLNGAETVSYVFVGHSWLAAMGIRPIFGMIGGVIKYRAGEWTCEVQLLPVNTYPTLQHAISWSEIDDGSATYQLEWHDDDHPRGLHESLTYEDIGYVGFGLGVTVAPTNEKWDVMY